MYVFELNTKLGFSLEDCKKEKNKWNFTVYNYLRVIST